MSNIQAFPGITIQDNPGYDTRTTKVYHRGMGLRDWFAGQALSALIQKGDGQSVKDIAMAAYAAADALIEVRKKASQ